MSLGILGSFADTVSNVAKSIDLATSGTVLNPYGTTATGTAINPFGTAVSAATSLGDTINGGITATPYGTTAANPYSTTGLTPSASLYGQTTDDRIRIGVLSNYQGSQSGSLLGGTDSAYPGIQAPLAQTNGLMFPYTPSISISQQVDYGHMDFTHSNWSYYYYSRTPNAEITLAGKFTCQNQSEGQYAIAAIQFLRGVSKMNFGEADQHAGLPPPMLQLSGYGDYMFKNVRCFVKTHSYSFDEHMDTVVITTSTGGTVRLPAVFTLNVTLITQPTVQMMRKSFSLDDYRSGALLQQGAGFF